MFFAMPNCEYLRYYHEAINGEKTKNYHKISGAADSLYSPADLFFTAQQYRLMLQGGCIRLGCCALCQFTGWDAIVK